MFDLNGRRVLNYKNEEDNGIINVSGLSAGEYILRIITSDQDIYSNKIIKK